jgi:hypothetical protein
MGLFGFKVGDQWLYAPVFFLNGDLKGHELLYIKKQGRLRAAEGELGQLPDLPPAAHAGRGFGANTFQLGGLMPNLSRLSRPPTGTKYGSDALPVCVDAWATPCRWPAPS